MIPAENVVGKIDDGWTVPSRLLFHERHAVGGSSPYLSAARLPADAKLEDLSRLARWLGRADEAPVPELLGEADMLATVMEQMTRRVARGIASGFFPESAGSMLRLYGGMALSRRATSAVEIAGQNAVACPPGAGPARLASTSCSGRRAASGGGTTEMARNIISERLLGMPREPTADRYLPFNQVRRA